jgi:hypothetical protein
MDLLSDGLPVILQPTPYTFILSPKIFPLNQGVTSTVAADALVDKIQAQETDSYFDEASKIHSVISEYTHTEGRQKRNYIHLGPQLVADVSWRNGARDGTWELTSITIYDFEGALNILNRPSIGSNDDITIMDGTVVTSQ